MRQPRGDAHWTGLSIAAPKAANGTAVWDPKNSHALDTGSMRAGRMRPWRRRRDYMRLISTCFDSRKPVAGIEYQQDGRRFLLELTYGF